MREWMQYLPCNPMKPELAGEGTAGGYEQRIILVVETKTGVI